MKRHHPSSSNSPLPALEYWEAERQLSEAFEKLKSAPRYDEIKSKVVGDFWEEGWHRAPFEECLTLKQLVDLKVETLVKKKSFDADKMVALAFAIEKAITGKSTARAAHLAARTVEVVVSGDPAPPRKSWKRLGDEVPAHAQALLAYFESEMASWSPESPLHPTLTSLPKSISSFEFISLWFLAEQDTATTAKILNTSQKELEVTRRRASEKVSRLIKRASVEIHNHWETALSGPGAREEILFDPYYLRDVDKGFQRAILKLFLYALGATNPIIGGTPLADHWAKNPKTAEVMLRALMVGLSPKKLDAELSLPFPFFDLESLKVAAKDLRKSPKKRSRA